MQYAKMFNCCAGIIACICFIACGRRTTAIDEQTVKINSIPCGYSDNKPAADSMRSKNMNTTGGKNRTFNNIKNNLK